MGRIFDSVRDGAVCMVEPAWMRAQRALASATADRLPGAVWTADVSDRRPASR